jgi:hypothetical protein
VRQSPAQVSRRDRSQFLNYSSFLLVAFQHLDEPEPGNVVVAVVQGGSIVANSQSDRKVRRLGRW